MRCHAKEFFHVAAALTVVGISTTPTAAASDTEVMNIFSSPVTVEPGRFAQLRSPACPEGWIIVGGGLSISSTEATPEAAWVSGYPETNSNTYVASVNNKGSVPLTYRVVATCLTKR